MKKVLFIILSILLLAACGPSPEELALQTHTAATATAASWTKTPTPTHTPTITPTPTPTPTYTPTPQPDRWQETLPDGSIRLIEAKVGFEFILPPDWEVTTISKAQYDEDLVSILEQDPEPSTLIDTLSILSQEAPIISAVYQDPSHSVLPAFSMLACRYFSLPSTEPNSIEKIASNLIEAMNSALSGATFSEPECTRNSSGVKYCAINFNQELISGESEAEIRGLYILFKVGDGVVFLIIGTHPQTYPAFADMFDGIINSIKLID